jgi:1,4-alpha-glucan branching enzyme
MASSDRAGMGAVPFADGVSFRVWAPNAASVAVAGDFNGWSEPADPLTHEGGGYWSCFAGFARIGHRYKFVIRNPNVAQPLWKNDPYARSIERDERNSVIAETGFTFQVQVFRPPEMNELLIYELHIGTFNAELGPGSFDTAIDRLDHIRDLGFSAVEIMAAGEFPYDISWGYNPAYIFAIESAFGGPNAFRRFVDAAHARGLAVLFDVVYNHFADEHLDMWQFDGWKVRDDKGGIYFYNDDRSHTVWGESRPDYGRPEVRQYLRDNALRWIETRAADGLRWDATNYIRNIDGSNDMSRDIPDGWRLMQRINDEIGAGMPWKITIAEDMQGNEAVTRETSVQEGAGFDAQWDADFHHTLRDIVRAPSDAGRDMNALARIIGASFNGDPFRRVIFTESHDEVARENAKQRLIEDIWPGNSWSWPAQKRSTLAAAIVFTAPGVPMIFQGQEFLASAPFAAQDALRWSEAHHGIERLYGDLARLRRSDAARGLHGRNVNIFHVNDGAKVIAYHRWAGGGAGDDVVVLANFSATPFPSYDLWFPRDGVWHVRFNSDWRGYSDVFGDQRSDDVVVSGSRGDASIGAYTAIVFSQ